MLRFPRGAALRTGGPAIYVPVRPNASLGALLKKRGRARVTVRLRFTAETGTAQVKHKKLSIVLRS